MFERYTEKARRVIFFARYEASQYGAHAIEAEHLLLGLLREDKLLVQALFKTPYLTPQAIRKEIEAASPILDKVSASVNLPLSTACKKALSYAADESKRLEHRHIGTAHLLLGIIREGQSLAARVLAEHGITTEQIVTALKEKEYLLHPAEPFAEPMHGGGRILGSVDPMLFQLFRQFRALLQLLVERGVITQEDGVIIQKEGVSNWGEGGAGSIHSFTRMSFNTLLDVLTSKGIISEAEKQRILETESSD